MMRRFIYFLCFVASAGLFHFYGVPAQAVQTANVASVQNAAVEIFVTSWCPYCRKLETFLKKSRIEYTRYDVEADANARDLFESLGGSGVPMSRVGKNIIHGYDPAGIIAALNE